MRLTAPALAALALATACATPPIIDDGIPDIVSRDNMSAFCRAQVAKQAGVLLEGVSVLPAESGGLGVLVFADVVGGEAAGPYTCNFSGDGTYRGVTSG